MKKIFLVAMAAIGFSAIAFAGTEDAYNCTYTGNSSDLCNASDGTRNLKVQNCKPGETDCYYYN